MNARHLRVLFALWPDAAVRASLAAASRNLHERRGGRRTRQDTLHLTLVFIGEIAVDRLPELFAAAEGVAVPKFEVLFDRHDCWWHNHIAHLGASQSPPELLNLVGQLESRLAAADIPFDRRQYVPHITLLRKADCSPQIENPALAPISWPARDFVLVSSSSRSGGAHYEQLGCWPLL
jgi:2'-5' RNA ligase